VNNKVAAEYPGDGENTSRVRYAGFNFETCPNLNRRLHNLEMSHPKSAPS